MIWNEQQIHQYIQGKLSQADMEAIEHEYQTNPEYRKRLDDFCEHNEILAALSQTQNAKIEQLLELAMEGILEKIPKHNDPTPEQSKRMWQKIQEKINGLSHPPIHQEQHLKLTDTPCTLPQQDSKTDGILFRWTNHGKLIWEGVPERIAAGEAHSDPQKLPPEIKFPNSKMDISSPIKWFPYGEEIILIFEPDSADGGYVLSLKTEYESSKRLEVIITYQDGTSSSFSGAELRLGGTHITEAQAKIIANVELKCSFE